MKRYFKLTVFLLICAFACASCAPNTYTGYSYQKNIFGQPKVVKSTYDYKKKSKRVKKIRKQRRKAAKRSACGY